MQHLPIPGRHRLWLGLRRYLIVFEKTQLSFLVNENILDKCFRCCSSSINPRILPLTMKYECPRLSLLNLIFKHDVTRNKNHRRLSHAIVFTALFLACLEHPILLTVTNLHKKPRKNLYAPIYTLDLNELPTSDQQYSCLSHQKSNCSDPTTSFLTAATLIYTIGDGITAAAGTMTCPPIDTC